MTNPLVADSSAIEVESLPYTPGAYVTGIDLCKLSEAAFAEVRQAWLVPHPRGQQYLATVSK